MSYIKHQFIKAFLTILKRLKNYIIILGEFLIDDVEFVKYGRWIEIESPWMERVQKCSYCKKIIKTISGQLQYCPNCGAKMNLEKKNE